MNLFEKNINALGKKNPDLAKKILSFVPTEIPQLVNQGGVYNFTYKNHFLHNPINPLAEAHEIFNMAENTPVAIHLVYGIGLGYLFQVVSANSKGTIILYEPDLSIIKTAFYFVDFTNDIMKENVHITDSLEKAEDIIYTKSNTKNLPLLLSTTEYIELNEKKFNELVSELQRQVGSFGMDLKYTKEKFYPLLKRIIENIPQLIKETPLTELKDKYKGKTAVVVSAGPTLDRNIEPLKQNRQNIVLIVVGTAMKAIAKHGLVPDFLCIIESNDCSKQIEGLDLHNVNLVTEPFSHPNIKSANFRKIYSHISSNMPVNSFWCDITGLSNDEYLSKGTVSYTALNTARILGCSDIILVGQDLAYIEGQCYSKDSAYKDLECIYDSNAKKWVIAAKDFDNFVKSLGNNPNPEIQKKIALERLQSLNNSLYYVKSIKGEMIPTESVYAAFIKPLTEFTQLYPDCKYINTSLVGAQIDGFENLPISEALSNINPINNIEINSNYCYNIELIKENLFKVKEQILPSLMIVNELKNTCKNLKNDIKRYKTITAEILKGVKKISTGYNVLSSDYAKKSKLLDFITISEKIDVDYEMKMFKDININSVANIIEKIEKFSEITEIRVNEITKLIDDKVKDLG